MTLEVEGILYVGKVFVCTGCLQGGQKSERGRRESTDARKQGMTGREL